MYEHWAGWMDTECGLTGGWTISHMVLEPIKMGLSDAMSKIPFFQFFR